VRALKKSFLHIVLNNDKDPSKMSVTHVLFESASGYAIFEAKLSEDIGSKTKSVQDSFKDLAKFGKMVQLLSFAPFKSAAQALENANDISEGALQLCVVGRKLSEGRDTHQAS
jgi:hypothetical protein